MKKFWLNNLALSLGLIGSSVALGQNSMGTNNFGPSSYPVQGQMVQTQLPQGPLAQGPFQVQSFRANPASQQGFNAQQPVSYGVVGPHQGQYSTVAAPMGQAEPIYSQPLQGNYTPQVTQLAPPPAGGNMAPYQSPAPQGCQSCVQDNSIAYEQGSNSAWQNSMAPNVASCGSAPVSSGSFAGAGWGRHALGQSGLTSLPTGAKPWFFGGGVLLFNRVDNTNKQLSFSSTDYGNNVIGTRSARMGLMPGVELTFGRYFNCGRNAIAVNYWGLFSDDEEAMVTGAAGAYNTRIPYTYLDLPVNIGAYANVADAYNNAQVHQLERSSEYHNVEVSLLGFASGGAARNFNLPTNGSMFSGTRGGGCGYCGGAGCGACGGSSCGTKFATGPCCLTAPSCGSRLNVSWLSGIRYFRFQDNLTYGASVLDTMVSRAADDIYYDVNTSNDLLGYQFGSRLDYCLGSRVNLYANAKAGIYGNRSSLHTRISTVDQTAMVNDPRVPANPYSGSYMFDASKTDVAFLGELGAGVGYRVTSKWTATTGYRVVFASGVATSVDNLQSNFANVAQVQDFYNDGSLILHGLNIGAVYNF